MKMKNTTQIFSLTAIVFIASNFSGLPAFACTDPSNSINAPTQLGDVKSSYKVYRENGCFTKAGADFIKLVDNLGYTNLGGGSGDTADIYRFTWRDPSRSVKLVTNGAQVKIYQDFGSGQRTLLTSSSQFTSSLSFSAGLDKSYILEFTNNAPNGTYFQYSSILN